MFLAARGAAISLIQDKLNPTDVLIERIDLIDIKILADVLKKTPYAVVMATEK